VTKFLASGRGGSPRKEGINEGYPLRSRIIAVKALFFNALIKALLLQPGPSRGRVEGGVTLGPAMFGGLACRI